ncbi:hypothetical protein AB0M28_09995 [Streptomyces sp. NPDC051940]|uniref:hypothetical protein n=1 Tax=Streptomyces sp. NPDC051940 TaxID=3155675 RepID=UPI003439BB61
MALESAAPLVRPARTALAARAVHQALIQAAPALGLLAVPSPSAIASSYEKWLLGDELGSVRPDG